MCALSARICFRLTAATAGFRLAAQNPQSETLRDNTRRALYRGVVTLYAMIIWTTQQHQLQQHRINLRFYLQISFKFLASFNYAFSYHSLLMRARVDSELEELDTPIRYRPDSLSTLCRTTRFTEAEIKRIYRGFKAECPSGVVREDTFKLIYAQFFPQGGKLLLFIVYCAAKLRF